MTQREALAVLKSGANVFLTGEPGSGKTHTINEYVEYLREHDLEPAVTASTGIAATHISGMTIHSWSGIGIAENLSAADIDRIAGKEHVARRIGKAKVLIIDEISMLSASIFNAVDAVLREARRSQEPFGGLQAILVGDFFQLPPVGRGMREAFAYESAAWRALNPLACYLTDQYRQEDDEYLAILNAIRRGEVEEMHYEMLTARAPGESGVPSDLPKLFSHNADVDLINRKHLESLPGKEKRYLMTSKGNALMVEGLKRGCLSPLELYLKVGAEVMFTKNSREGRFVNGTLGKVTGYDADGMPLVHTKGGETITGIPMEWRVEENGKVKASITQVPLRLAWAITIHKSQGMSLDAASIDLSSAFEYGQGYVALSRVRSLSGLHLLGMNRRALEVDPQILEKDQEFRELSSDVGRAFSAMAREELHQMHKNFLKTAK